MKKVLIFFWASFILGSLTVFLFFYSAKYGYGFFNKLPSFEKIENPDLFLSSEIFSEDNQLLGKYYKENRTNLKYKDLSKNLYNALIATEDKRFYNHSGIDLRGTLRALITFGKSGGGSTITQQLAKMMFNDPVKNKWERVKQKFQEWILAVEIEKRYTKKEIIIMYLNIFDFLNNAVGIKSASMVYFSKKPKDLTVEESAMLIGMAKNPALYNPLTRLEKTRKRRNVVLALMYQQGYITDSVYKIAKASPINIKFKKVDHKAGLAPYFREYFRLELQTLLKEKNADGSYKYAKKNGEPYNIYNDGLKIYTTLNSKMQKYAEWSVKEYITNYLQPQFSKDLKIYRKSKYPFDNEITRKQYKIILKNSMKRSRRYRVLAGKECENCGRRGEYVKHENHQYVCQALDCGHIRKDVNDQEIEKIFNTPINIKLFSYNGMFDTIISPLDSIKYHKTFLQVGMMAVDPKTGYIKVWVGGTDYYHFKYDHVKQSKRQVGSTFKPFIYTVAIQNGYSPCDKVPNVRVVFKKGEQGASEEWSPQNSDKVYGCSVSLKYALANSMNTISAWIIKQFGAQVVVNLIKKMGIEDVLPVPSIALGVSDKSVYEMVGALATYANYGVYIKPTVFTRVEDKHGNIILDFIPKTTEAMSPKEAHTVLDMMKGVVDGVRNNCLKKLKKSSITYSGTGIRLRGTISKERPYVGHKYPIAAKTGTTQNNSDGWFVGLTPDLVTGVWVGANDRAVHFSTTAQGQGANTALPIWGYFMQKVYQDTTLKISKEDFIKPDKFKIEDCNSIENNDVKETLGI